MIHTIKKYIDTCLIDEYAHRDLRYGYSLEAVSLPAHEQANFLDFLFKHDADLRNMIFDHMQHLLDQRLTSVEVEDRRSMGMRPIKDILTGETQWTPRRDIAC